MPAAWGVGPPAPEADRPQGAARPPLNFKDQLGSSHETEKIVRREPSEWPLVAHNGPLPPPHYLALSNWSMPQLDRGDPHPSRASYLGCYAVFVVRGNEPVSAEGALRDKNLCIIRVHATGSNSEKTPIDTALRMHDPDREVVVGYDLRWRL